MRTFTFLLAAAATMAAVAEGGEAELVERKSSPWHLSVGPVLSPRVRVRMHCPRPVLPAPPAPRQSAPGDVGNVPADPSAGYVDRQYEDGYVKPDEGTTDPDSMVSGLTWNWGADNVGAQYAGGSMEFHTGVARWSESVSSSDYRTGGGGGDDRDALLGVELKGGLNFFETPLFDAAVDLGARYYGSGDQNVSAKYGTTVTTTRNEYRYVDRYSAAGWTDVPKGGHVGSAGGPGRLLGAMPTRSEELMGLTRSAESQRYRSHTRLNYDIWDLRLGPSLGWRATRYLTLRGGVYGLLGLVDATMKTETETPRGSQGAKKSVCAGVFGVAAGLSAQVNVTEDVFLVGAIEYDWWSDAVHMKTGGGDARIKLSDVTASLSLGVAF